MQSSFEECRRADTMSKEGQVNSTKLLFISHRSSKAYSLDNCRLARDLAPPPWNFWYRLRAASTSARCLGARPWSRTNCRYSSRMLSHPSRDCDGLNQASSVFFSAGTTHDMFKRGPVDFWSPVGPLPVTAALFNGTGGIFRLLPTHGWSR